MPIRRRLRLADVWRILVGGGNDYAVGGNVGPSATFTATPSGLTVAVNATGSIDPDGTILTYTWAWGDSTADGAGLTASHTYATSGAKTITLTVTDNAGAAATATRTVTTGSTNVGPTASFTVSTQGLTVTVNGTASSDPDGTIASYAWAWGDGTTNATGSTQAHTYATAGTRTITLTVTDNSGATASTTRSATTTGGSDAISLRRALPDNGNDPAGGTDPYDPALPKTFTIDATTCGLLPGWTADMLTVDTRTSFPTANASQVVIENRRFTSAVTVTGSNYLFRNCKFNGQNTLLTINPSGHIILEDCEWERGPAVSGSIAITGHNFTARRCNIHGTEDGIRPYRAAGNHTALNVNFYNTWIHDLFYYSPDDIYGGTQPDNGSHCDGIQVHGGGGVKFVHCRLEGTIDPAKGDASDLNVGGTSGSTAHVSGNWNYTAAPLTPEKLLATSVVMFSPVQQAINGEWLFDRCDIAGGHVAFNMGAHTSSTGLVIRNCRWTRPRPRDGSTTNPTYVAWNSARTGSVVTGNRDGYANHGHTAGTLHNP